MDYESECVMFEVKSKLKWWCCILLYVALIVCCYMIYIALVDFINNTLSSGLLIFMLIFFLIPLGVAILYNLFYCLNNRLYITEQGIGFEVRHYFRMQKRFFRFGEIGLCINSLYDMPRFTITSRLNYIFYDINIEMKPMLFGYIRDKNYKHYIFCKIYTEIDIDNIKNMLNFIRKKTEQSLQMQGINISNNELKSKFRYLEREDI